MSGKEGMLLKLVDLDSGKEICYKSDILVTDKLETN